MSNYIYSRFGKVEFLINSGVKLRSNIFFFLEFLEGLRIGNRKYIWKWGENEFKKGRLVESLFIK